MVAQLKERLATQNVEISSPDGQTYAHAAVLVLSRPHTHPDPLQIQSCRRRCSFVFPRQLRVVENLQDGIWNSHRRQVRGTQPRTSKTRENVVIQNTVRTHRPERGVLHDLTLCTCSFTTRNSLYTSSEHVFNRYPSLLQGVSVASGKEFYSAPFSEQVLDLAEVSDLRVKIMAYVGTGAPPEWVDQAGKSKMLR